MKHGIFRGNVIALTRAQIRRLTRARAALRHMHGQKVVSAQLFAFPAKSDQKTRPILGRDIGTLLPLLDPISGVTGVGGHLGERFPGIKDRIKSCHKRHNAPDELSGQGPPMIPMTQITAKGTISPMGRGVTPIRFRAEMAKRLSSARVVAGFETKKQAADALGVGLDRYEKWESGRTPVPAQYVAPVCELFGIDANYLFGIMQTQRKVASQ